MRKEHEAMDPSRMVIVLQVSGGGALVWRAFNWLTLCLYQYLNALMPEHTLTLFMRS